MFKGMGDILNLMKNLPKMQEEMQKLQARLGQLSAEGSAGGGMVTAQVNGKLELLGCRLSEEALKLQDAEMIEDLVIAAVNDALTKARTMVAEETAKTSGLPGFPGMTPPTE